MSVGRVGSTDRGIFLIFLLKNGYCCCRRSRRVRIMKKLVKIWARARHRATFRSWIRCTMWFIRDTTMEPVRRKVSEGYGLKLRRWGGWCANNVQAGIIGSNCVYNGVSEIYDKNEKFIGKILRKQKESNVWRKSGCHHWCWKKCNTSILLTWSCKLKSFFMLGKLVRRGYYSVTL